MSVKRLVMLLALALWICGCSPTAPTPEAPPDPAAVLTEAVLKLRDQNTFRLLIEQVGAVYPFYVSLDQGASQVQASMRRAEAQFATPDELFAKVKLELPPLPAVNVDIFAKSDNQWFRLGGGDWVNFPIATGFNPGELVKENGGFAKALGQLREISYIGTEALIDGTNTWHIRGFADGDVINGLMFNLLAVVSDRVQVDVYVDITTRIPAKISVLVPATATEAEPQDTQWNIEIYDGGAPAVYIIGADGNPTEAQP